MSIRDDLRVRISAHEWRAGERLPSEADLAAHYGVARMTIRQAVGALASEGMVVRRQGLGTFAVEQLPTRTTNELMSYTEEMTKQGHDVRTRLLGAAVDQPPPAARGALGLGRCTAAILIRRVREVNDYPIVLQNSWLPFARFAGLITQPLLDGSLYAMIEDRYGVRIVRARQAITATAADDYTASVLGLEPGEPVLRTVRTTYDSSNLAIEYAISAMRPGYPVDVVLERQPLAGRPAAPPDLVTTAPGRSAGDQRPGLPDDLPTEGT
jgi:GntR family transcriptional regulator